MNNANLNITGTTITIFSTSKHLIKIQVENHGYCMTIMQVGIVACLGWKKSPGESARSSRNESPEIFLSQRGLNKGKGIMVIFRILTHGESVTNRTGSTIRRNGLWNHLKQSPIDLKLHRTHFWKESNPGHLESTSRKLRGGHEVGGAPTLLGAPSTLVGPSWIP